jgi:hypothetical protein
MMTISQPGATEPVTARARLAALIGESDRRSSALGQRLAAWAEGYERGFDAGSEVGYGAAAHQEAQQRRETAGLVAEITGIQRARWSLRGQHRTRQTFAAPHPDDYEGGTVQPW